MLSKKQKATVAAVTLLALTGTGTVAFAFWTTDGSGTGAASTAAGETSVFKVVGDVPLAMYPGDSDQTITATVTNTSATTSYRVASLKAFVTTDKAGCDGTDYNINGSTTAVDAATAVTIAIVPKDLAALEVDNQTADYTIRFNNKAATNQDVCKGALVTVNYLAS
jgi:hypothetical protein